MLGFSYASIPLYQIYCQASGFNGTVQKYTNPPPYGEGSKDPSVGEPFTRPSGSEDTRVGSGPEGRGEGDIENMQENTEVEIQKDV